MRLHGTGYGNPDPRAGYFQNNVHAGCSAGSRSDNMLGVMRACKRLSFRAASTAGLKKVSMMITAGSTS